MAVSTDEIETRISELYVGLIGRAPDRDGLNFWAAGYRNRLERGQSDSESLKGIAQAMFESAGARTYYPEGASERGIVEQFYQNVLGRVGDDQGIGFWTNALGNSRQTGDVLVEMIEAVKSFTGDDPAGQTSQTLFSKKATVAVHYGTQVSQSGQTAIDEASAILDAVDVETDVSDDTALGTFISSVEPGGSEDSGGTDDQEDHANERLTSAEAKALLARDSLAPSDGGLFVVYENGADVIQPEVDQRLTVSELDTALAAFDYVAVYDQLGPAGPLTIESGEYLSASAGDVVSEAGIEGQVNGAGTLELRLFPETAQFPNVATYGFDLTNVSGELNLKGVVTGSEQGGAIDITGFDAAEVESFRRLESVEFDEPSGNAITLAGDLESLTGQTINAGDASDVGVRIEGIDADSASSLDTSGIFADAPSAGTLSLVLDEEAGEVDLQQALDISGVDTIEIPAGVTAVIPASAFSGGATPVTASGAGNVRVVGVDEATTGLDGMQVTGDITLETAGASADGSSELIALSLPADLLDRNPENNPSPFSSVEIRGDSLGVVRLRGANDSDQITGSRDFGHVSVQSGIDVDIPVAGAVDIEGTLAPDAFKLTETLTAGSSLSGGTDSFGSGIVFGENPATPVESIPVDIDMTSVSFDAVRRLFLEGDGTEVTFGGEQLGGQAIDINTMNATEGERTSESGSGANGQTLIIDIEGQGGTSTSTDLSELTFSNFDTAAGLFRWNGGEDTLRINGGVADDEIIGTAVADIVSGGEGADIFEYAPGQGGGFPSEIPNTDAPENQDRIVKFDGPVDEITDFVFGEDVLSLTSEAIGSGRLSTLEEFKLADEADVGISFGIYNRGADNATFTYTTTSDDMRNASVGADESEAMDVLIYADEEKPWDADPSDATASWIVLNAPTGPNGSYMSEADMLF